MSRWEGVALPTEPGLSTRRMLADPILMFAFLVPLIPSPAVGVLGALVPVSVVGVLLVASFLRQIGGHAAVSRESGLLGATVLLVSLTVLSAYGLRIFLHQAWDELAYLGSKTFLLLGVLVVFYALASGYVRVVELGRAFLLGYLALAVVMVYVGVTGTDVLAEVAASRTYGFTIPFHKTAGVPRSFGELAMLSGAAWAFLLVFRHSFTKRFWILAASLVALSVLVAQSRTGILVVVVVTALYPVLAGRSARFSLRLVLAGIVLFPFLGNTLLEFASTTFVGQAFIGTETIEANAFGRAEMMEKGMELLFSASPFEVALGFDRADWYNYYPAFRGEGVVIHNHYMSTWLFFGLIPGTLLMATLYVIPPIACAMRAKSSPEARFVLLASIASLVALAFYEGFYSPWLMIMIAMSLKIQADFLAWRTEPS